MRYHAAFMTDVGCDGVFVDVSKWSMSSVTEMNRKTAIVWSKILISDYDNWIIDRSFGLGWVFDSNKWSDKTAWWYGDGQKQGETQLYHLCTLYVIYIDRYKPINIYYN